MSIFKRIFVLSSAALALIGAAVATPEAPSQASTAVVADGEISTQSLYWG
ncbi:hypothetical protein ACIQ9R_24820 [Streptomyces sp. NPDC094447]